MTEVAGRWQARRYPDPPETTWEDLQRYTATKLLADGFLSQDQALGLDSDPLDRWARAERAYQALSRPTS